MHKKLAVTIVVLSGIDGLLTMWATNHGFVEVNPLMRPIAHTWILPVWKTAIAGVGVAFALWLLRRFLKPGSRLALAVPLGLTAAIIFLLMVLVLNLLEFT